MFTAPQFIEPFVRSIRLPYGKTEFIKLSEGSQITCVENKVSAKMPVSVYDPKRYSLTLYRVCHSRWEKG
jgi:hypothetical protein